MTGSVTIQTEESVSDTTLSSSKVMEGDLDLSHVKFDICFCTKATGGFFFKVFCRTYYHVLFWATVYVWYDFWWCLLWVSKPEWVLPYSNCEGECNVHFLRSTSGATCCQPLDGQHCGASTRFISCPRILLCGSSESQTCDQEIMSAAR